MHIANNVVHLGGIPATEIAAVFGTPLYVMEAESIIARYEHIVENIPYRPLTIHYACKANANVRIMRLLREIGAHLDACSPGDLAFADAAGFSSSEISYTSTAMSTEELQIIADRQVRFNADSLSELKRYGSLAPGRSVGLRINCGVVAGFHPHVQSAGIDSKFGIHPNQLPEARRIAGRHQLRLTGLHVHLGSDLFDIQAPLQALNILIELSSQLPDLQFLDVGGGWGVPFGEDDAEYDMASYGMHVAERMEHLSLQRGRRIALHMEPGAYLVSDAGTVLTRVTQLKPQVTINGKVVPIFVGTDTSYNHVFSAAIYDSYHRILVAGRVASPQQERYHIVGNLMQAGDVLARDRLLPRLREGDLLAIRNCGGYSACRAPTFNERPRPAEVLVQGGLITLIRRAESVSDLLLHQIY